MLGYSKICELTYTYFPGKVRSVTKLKTRYHLVKLLMAVLPPSLDTSNIELDHMC